MHSEFRTLETAVEFARACQKQWVPRHLKAQLIRSSSSVALNLAEGSAKESSADRYRFYRIALGSFREAETILRISECSNHDLQNMSNKLAAQITKLCNSQN